MAANDKAQAEKFKQAARELGCDEDEAHFKEALKKVLSRRAPPPGTLPSQKKPKTTKPGK